MKTNWQFEHKAIITKAKAEVQLSSTIITFSLAALKQKLQCTPIEQLKPLKTLQKIALIDQKKALVKARLR